MLPPSTVRPIGRGLAEAIPNRSKAPREVRQTFSQLIDEMVGDLLELGCFDCEKLLDTLDLFKEILGDFRLGPCHICLLAIFTNVGEAGVNEFDKRKDAEIGRYKSTSRQDVSLRNTVMFCLPSQIGDDGKPTEDAGPLVPRSDSHL